MVKVVFQEFDDGCDFVIDRKRRSSPIYLENFVAPKLLDSSSKDEKGPGDKEREGYAASDRFAYQLFIHFYTRRFRFIFFTGTERIFFAVYHISFLFQKMSFFDELRQ